MDNQEFLTVVGNSFKKFLETGSRSNEKLKILHGAIAKDLKERLGVGYYVQSLGVGNGKEMKIWRYDGIVPEGKVVLVNPMDLSFDSRYFGFVDTKDIKAKVIPFWTWGQELGESYEEVGLCFC